MHLLTKGTPFNDLSEGCAVRIKISLYFQKKALAYASAFFNEINPCGICENIKEHYSLVNQLERSATSIGANIHEANYAHGKLDYVAKLQITLKECY